MKKTTLFGKLKSLPVIGKTLLVVCAFAVIGCVSLSLSVNMGPKVDPDFFQFYKTGNERLVYLSPLKAPNHSCSYLYVITNAEDIQKAQDKMGKITTASMQDIEKGLAEFSPIMIGSPTNNDEGIGIFHLPPSANKVFYAYIPYKTGDTLSNRYQTKVYCGILSLPANSEDVFVEFSEQKDDIKISTTRRSEDIKNIFKTRINGPYAWYVATRTPRAYNNKPQMGFIEFFVKEYGLAYLSTEAFDNALVSYEEPIKIIKQRGRNIVVGGTGMPRQTFIQRYQGRPDTASVRAAYTQEHQYQRNMSVTEQDIVNIAKREPNSFNRVRIIHDWVADVFAYDFDLKAWMDKSGRNASFTIEQIIDKRRGVCFEYAILFWNLMDRAGIETYLICDSSQPGISHAYNMVIINGTGYIVDTTWDSGNKYKNGRLTNQEGMNKLLFFMPSISKSYESRDW